MKKLLLLFVNALILTSCSSLKTIHSHKSSQSIEKIKPDRVDIVLDNAQKVEKAIEVAPLDETVRVGEHGGDLYTVDQSSEDQRERKKLRIGLSFGPGIYRTINYVSILKILERQNLSPDIITGTGFGAIVASMYAVGMTPEVIEWNFYKYFKEKRGNKPYDQDWFQEIDNTLLSKLRSFQIQDAKKKLFLTLYDHKTKKTYYFDKGNIRDLLLLNLKLSTDFKESKSGQKYSTAFEKEVYNARLLRQLGAEFTIAVDVLGTKFDFDVPNEFLIGVYGRTAGRIQKEKKDFDYAVTLPLSLMNLDSTKESPLFMQKSFEFMQKQIPVLVKKLNDKIESSINAGNE